MDKTFDIYKAELESQRKAQKTELRSDRKYDRDWYPDQVLDDVIYRQVQAGSIYYVISSWEKWAKKNEDRFAEYPIKSDLMCQRAVKLARELEETLGKMIAHHPTDYTDPQGVR